MRLPSSSSLLLASLASSSSLSALAAPAGDCHGESSSPAVPASLHSDDRAAAVTQSNNYLESRDILSDLSGTLSKVLGLVSGSGDKVPPKARDGLPAGLDSALNPVTGAVGGILSGGAAGGKTARAEKSEANGTAQDSPPPPGSSSPSPAAGAGPDGGVNPPATPFKKLPSLPVPDLPVKPPVSPPGVPAQAPADLPVQPPQPSDHPGRRDSNGASLPVVGDSLDLSKLIPPPL